MDAVVPFGSRLWPPHQRPLGRLAAEILANLMPSPQGD